MFQKVFIFGRSGSGKSTAAEQIKNFAEREREELL